MSTKKTIQINPELFKLSGNKTRKVKEKKELTINPVISPNNLRNKLLKRIKDHKQQETKIKPESAPATTYSDEFYGALDYLSDLSKKHKVTEAKQRSLNTKTLKNYQTPTHHTELPPELQETNVNTIMPQSNEVFNVKYKAPDELPYGCLKNGRKKTYREWMREQQGITPDVPDIVRPPTPPKQTSSLQNTTIPNTTIPNTTIPNTTIPNTTIPNTTNLSREARLEQIKTKLKQLQDNESQIKEKSMKDFKEIEKKYTTPLMTTPLEELKDLDAISKSTDNDIDNMITDREGNTHKNCIKKTIKRRFTLGKSDKLRRVSVLIKDRQTRKQIIDTQKELKKTKISDVKKYLREHGILKVGSTCPTDILRTTFESAVLTGDVINTNKDTMLHNFISSSA